MLNEKNRDDAASNGKGSTTSVWPKYLTSVCNGLVTVRDADLKGRHEALLNDDLSCRPGLNLLQEENLFD